MKHCVGTIFKLLSLNPCCNGMKIEYTFLPMADKFKSVLILVVME